jgi:hypothetical protein
MQNVCGSDSGRGVVGNSRRCYENQVRTQLRFGRLGYSHMKRTMLFSLFLSPIAFLVGGCANPATPLPQRDSSGPVVRDVIPAQNGHPAIPVVETHSP